MFPKYSLKFDGLKINNLLNKFVNFFWYESFHVETENTFFWDDYLRAIKKHTLFYFQLGFSVQQLKQRLKVNTLEIILKTFHYIPQNTTLSKRRSRRMKWADNVTVRTVRSFTDADTGTQPRRAEGGRCSVLQRPYEHT